MVFYPIQVLVNAGIEDILIVTGGEFAGDFIKVLKNGEAFGLPRLNYAYQEGNGGIADALAKAETFVGEDSCVVILGDNLVFEDLSHAISEFEVMGGAKIFTKEVEDPERFGVVEYSNMGEVCNLHEKPTNPPSKDAVIGVYLYDNTVFEKIKKLSPSARGELEVTDLNKMYLHEGALSCHKIQGTWLDCGTFESLAEATKILREDTKTNE